MFEIISLFVTQFYRISTVRGGEKKELDGAGRPLLDPIFDKRLAAWVRETRATGTKVTLSQIVREAQRLQRPAFGPQSNTELKVFIIDLFYSLFSVTDEPWMVNELHSSPQIQRKKGNAPLSKAARRVCSKNCGFRGLH